MHSDPTFALPDPIVRPEFYDGVPAKRLIAWLLDVVLIGIIATILFVVLIVPAVLTVFGVFLLPAIFAFLGFFYRWMTLASGSATWGMRVMAIQIRQADGTRLTSSTALLHTIGYYLSFSTFIVQAASVIMMLTGARKQGLTDLVLDTAAINRPAAGW